MPIHGFPISALGGIPIPLEHHELEERVYLVGEDIEIEQQRFRVENIYQFDDYQVVMLNPYPLACEAGYLLGPQEIQNAFEAFQQQEH